MDGECNYVAAGSWEEVGEDDEYVEDFEIAQVQLDERTTLNISVENIRRWVGSTKLKVLQNNAANNAYQTKKELGLFHMFMHRSFFECIRQWTNGNMARKCQSSKVAVVTTEEMYAYVGL